LTVDIKRYVLNIDRLLYRCIIIKITLLTMSNFTFVNEVTYAEAQQFASHITLYY